MCNESHRVLDENGQKIKPRMLLETWELIQQPGVERTDDGDDNMAGGWVVNGEALWLWLERPDGQYVWRLGPRPILPGENPDPDWHRFPMPPNGWNRIQGLAFDEASNSFEDVDGSRKRIQPMEKNTLRYVRVVNLGG